MIVIRVGVLVPLTSSLLEEVDEEGGVMLELWLVLGEKEEAEAETEAVEETVLAAPCNRGDATGGNSAESLGVAVIFAKEEEEEEQVVEDEGV